MLTLALLKPHIQTGHTETHRTGHVSLISGPGTWLYSPTSVPGAASANAVPAALSWDSQQLQGCLPLPPHPLCLFPTRPQTAWNHHSTTSLSPPLSGTCLLLSVAELHRSEEKKWFQTLKPLLEVEVFGLTLQSFGTAVSWLFHSNMEILSRLFTVSPPLSWRKMLQK